jgi:hypothetical protein
MELYSIFRGGYCLTCKDQVFKLQGTASSPFLMISRNRTFDTFDILWLVWGLIDFDRSGKKVISGIGGSLIPGAQCCNLQLSRQLAPASLHFISRCLGFLCSMAGCGWLTDTVVSSNREQTMVDSWLVWGPQFQETSKLMILCYKLLDSQETVLFGTINLIKH